jgi:hypothetical protein
MKSTTRLSALLLGVATACTTGSEDPNVIGNQPRSDGGDVDRTVTDGGMRRDGGDGSPDGSPADVNIKTDTADLGDRDVMIEFLNPAAEKARVKSTIMFSPQVKVTFPAGETIMSVTVTPIVNEVAGAPVTLDPEVRMENPDAGQAFANYGKKPVALTGIPSGEVVLEVVAKTVKGLEGRQYRTIKVDSGPSIIIAQPEENEPRKGSAPVKVTITDAAFGVDAASVQAFVGNFPLTLTKTDATTWQTTINFADFMPPLTGEQLIKVLAKNNAGATTSEPATESQTVRKFVIDNAGPLFEMASPVANEMIGGVVNISAKISDGAGVLDSSVVVVVGHGGKEYEVKLNPPAPNAVNPVYTGLFDTSRLPKNAISPSVSFRAADKLGNESTLGYFVILDNNPPLSELDPPDDFRALENRNGEPFCSWQFDPVGPDAVDDGEKVAQLFDIRARIEDQGNEALSGGQDTVFLSGVKEGDVDLVILDDTTQPLVVDLPDAEDDEMDNGGPALPTCDTLNPQLVPTTVPRGSKDLLVVDMVPLQPAGVADFLPDVEASCNSGGAQNKPAALCESTEDLSKARYDSFRTPHSEYMTRIISYNVAREPAIWTIGQIVAGPDPRCGGTQFDTIGNNISDGWACLAVVAKDKLGNKSVSRPIRVCIDKDSDGVECPHKSIVSVANANPAVVTTAAAHGLATGDQVFIHNVKIQTGVNGTRVVTVTGANTFTVNGFAARLDLNAGFGGEVVKTSVVPDCTGLQTTTGANAQVDGTKKCQRWRRYESGETRLF